MSAPTGHDIHLARHADAPSVERLVHDAYLPYVARIGRPPAPMTVDYGQAIRDGTVWVVEVDGQVRGVLVLIRHVDHLLIDNIAVDPQTRGTGLGHELLQHAEQQARALGLTELRLYTNELMTENLAYYPRRGFRETGRRVHNGYARVYFSKQLC